ncbi:hypothetical protein B0H14DRAFT_2563356 [Mycena olivaceomarginata]|nr:hypothetical protein B0H14DRAFT_2563356 [Mycena olivaceomarginata]
MVEKFAPEHMPCFLEFVSSLSPRLSGLPDRRQACSEPSQTGGEGTYEVDRDIEMHDVERADEKTALPFLELVIKTLGTQAGSCGAVLTMIQEHTMDSIDIHHKPLYHTSTSARENPSTPAIYGDEFGDLGTFLRQAPPASLQESSDSLWNPHRESAMWTNSTSQQIL